MNRFDGHLVLKVAPSVEKGIENKKNKIQRLDQRFNEHSEYREVKDFSMEQLKECNFWCFEYF